MRIFVCANLDKSKTREAFPEVIKVLKGRNMTPIAESRYSSACKSMNITDVLFGEAEENAASCDIFLTVGGDGTILRWGKKAALHNKPLLGINTGRLGFMATLEKDDISKLYALSDGSYELSTRMLIDVSIASSNEIKQYIALNDVVLFKGVTSKLPEYVVSSGSTEVIRIRADGIIISTPTGSTAYSLSAGGPIIDPDLSCFEMNALSPHTLFARPMIFSTEKPLTAGYIAYENSDVFVSVDGDKSVEIAQGDEILIKKSDLCLKLIDINGGSFYSSVHNKLMQPLK